MCITSTPGQNATEFTMTNPPTNLSSFSFLIMFCTWLQKKTLVLSVLSTNTT